MRTLITDHVNIIPLPVQSSTHVHQLCQTCQHYEGKLPLKCFLFKKIGQFASRCPKRVPKKTYKHKFFKRCYYVVDEVVTDDESDKGNLSDNKWVFIAIKEDYLIPTYFASYMNVEKPLASQVEEKD